MFLNGHGLKPIFIYARNNHPKLWLWAVMVSAPLNDKANPVSRCSAFASNPENSRLAFSGCKWGFIKSILFCCYCCLFVSPFLCWFTNNLCVWWQGILFDWTLILHGTTLHPQSPPPGSSPKPPTSKKPSKPAGEALLNGMIYFLATSDHFLNKPDITNCKCYRPQQN